MPWSMILVNLSIIIIKNILNQIWHQITDEWNVEFWGNMKGRKVKDKKQKLSKRWLKVEKDTRMPTEKVIIWEPYR